MRKLYEEKEELMVANKSMAEYNLSQEPILKAKRDRMAAKHREAIEMIAKVKKLKEELEQKSGKVQPDSLYYLLEVRKKGEIDFPEAFNNNPFLPLFQIDASKVETESDDVVNEYLEGNIQNTDEFLEKFIVSRHCCYWSYTYWQDYVSF